MIEELRTPFFVAALVLVVVIVLLEIGLVAFRPPVRTDQDSISEPANEELRAVLAENAGAIEDAASSQEKPSGLGIPYLALVDGILLFTVGLMALGMVVRRSVHGRIQGVATFVFSLLILIGSIVLIMAALVATITRISLFIAVPFGTLIYLAVYGFFNRGAGLALLGALMSMKVAFAWCLIAAQQRFLQMKGLVFLFVTSVVAQVVVAVLYSIVPPFLVSITDAIAGIVVGIIAVIWSLILLIGSIGPIIRALKPAPL